LDNVTGSETEELENAELEKLRLCSTSDLCPVEVIVIGCFETAPLEPLKERAVVERE
jgi:hypothetical protein